LAGMNVASIVELVSRLGLDVVSLVVMAGLLYRQRRSAPEMPLVFTSLNLGLFAAVTVISGHHFSAGVGFGLFGLLSLVRLRSAAFTLQDVAYTFTSLVLGLANGLLAAPMSLVIGINVVLLAALAIVDESRNGTHTRVMRLTLDRAMVDPNQILREAADQLPDRVVALVIEAVDHVRDITRISVRHELDSSSMDENMPELVLRGVSDDDD
jgi:hypothetical protein